MRNFKYLILVAVLFVFLIMSCTASDQADVDVDDFNMLKYAEAFCPWDSVCGSDRGFYDCYYRFLTNDDYYSLESVLYINTFKKNLACLKNVTNCDEYYSCVNISLVDQCDETMPSWCEGNMLFRCEDNRITRWDCSLSDQPACTFGHRGATCGSVEIECTDQLEDTCQGSLSFWCPGEYSTVPIVFDCEKYGYQCKDGDCVDKGDASCEETVMSDN